MISLVHEFHLCLHSRICQPDWFYKFWLTLWLLWECWPNWIKICCTGTDFPYWANFHFHELAVNQGVKMHVWFALRYCWADRLGWQTVVRKPTFGLLEGFLRFWLDNWSWQKYAMSLKMVIVLHIVLKKWSNRCIVMYMYKKIIIYWNRITIRM